MNPLQIQLHVGAAAGRRARFERSPITFGRDTGNLLVIEDEHVSRQHGEIRFDQGQWMLVNHSVNGIKVNKKTVKDKPRPIQSGDEVSISKTLLFTMTIEAIETDHGETSLAVKPLDLSGQDQPDLPPRRSKKKKLWIGMVGYVGALLFLIIFLSTLGGNGQSAGDQISELTHEQITEFIREPLPKRPYRDDVYEDAIKRGDDMEGQTDSRINGLYKRYFAYQTAIANSEHGKFKSKDIGQTSVALTNVRNALTAKVIDAYDDAIVKLSRGDDQGAYRAFQRLLEMYPDTQSKIYKNCDAKLNLASKRMGKEKLKK